MATPRWLHGVWHRQGFVDALLLFVPAIPFGFVVGLTASQRPIGSFAGWLSAPLLFAGAAQLAVVSIASSTAWLAAIVTALVINSRHVMYSAAMAPAFKEQPRWMRWVGSYFLIDQVFALNILRVKESPLEFRRYYLTSGIVFITGWLVAVAAGVFFGGSVPTSWRLSFAPAIMFTGLVTMGIVKRSQVVAAVIGASACWLTIELDNKVCIIIGGLAGVCAGTVIDTFDQRHAESWS